MLELVELIGTRMEATNDPQLENLKTLPAGGKLVVVQTRRPKVPK